MVIGSSSINMMAQTKKSVSYTENKQTLMKNLATGEKQFSINTFTSTYEQCAKNRLIDENNLKEKGNAKDKENLHPEKRKVEEKTFIPEKDRLQELMEQLKEFLINFRKRLSLLIGGQYERYLREDPTYGKVLDLSQNQGGFSLWKKTEYISYSRSESETMNFSTTGKVVTADGREIEFDMELAMSREFVEETEVLSTGVMAVMTDPLVISLEDCPVSVSDQKWQFDIDGDGEEDSISMLNGGSGYLVLDRNGDGKINDGTEMFGAKTGNGFLELAEFDEDGNGWIDEKDSIYEKLSVWQKDSAGTDKLMSLKNAKVGAIYLGSVASEFALKSLLNNEHNAQIRRSGMYLSEDGIAKSLTQLDMVKALIS